MDNIIIKELHSCFALYINKDIELYDKKDYDDTITTFDLYKSEILEIIKITNIDIRIQKLQNILDRAIIYLEDKMKLSL